MSFLKIEGWETFVWGKRLEREGQLVDLVGDYNSGPEAPPMSKREGRKKDVRGGVTDRKVMEKSGYVRFIEGRRSKEMTQFNTFFPWGSGLSFESQRG